MYNESVNNNNVRIEQFPDVVIANFFKFKSFELLEFSDAEKAEIARTLGQEFSTLGVGMYCWISAISWCFCLLVTAVSRRRVLALANRKSDQRGSNGHVQ